MSITDRRGNPEIPQISQLKKEEDRNLGAAPGYFCLPEDAKFPEIRVFSYNEQACHEQTFYALEPLFEHLDRNNHLKHWLDVEGYGNQEFYEGMQERFKMHNLAIEDTISNHQRPKVEGYENHLFIISRMLYHLSTTGELMNEQLAFFMYEDLLITIQDEYEDCLEPVRERLRKGKGIIRTAGTFYLTYALIDTIVDNYFPMIDKNSTRLEQLEAEIMKNTRKEQLTELMQIKKEIIKIRKAVLAERDKIAELLRSEYSEKNPKVSVYFRDAYDHCVQIIEILETEKEIAYSLMDVYMSNVGNKTNDIMKFLTILSSIFVPLTFIAGVYGMNFASTDAKGNAIPGNMPELYAPYGYFITWGVMIVFVMLQILYFRQKGWIMTKD
jgi:magnesium transporter